MHTKCIQLVHRQTGVAQVVLLSAAERQVFNFVFSNLLPLSPFYPSLSQGFDDQPGVEPQWFLSAQRCHNLLQPITVQLHDLQVETRSRRLQLWTTIPTTPLHCPYYQPKPTVSAPSSLDSVSTTQPVSGTEACLHKQKTKNKIICSKKKIQRLCTI